MKIKFDNEIGGGWSWKLGMVGSKNSIVIHLLFWSIRIDRR